MSKITERNLVVGLDIGTSKISVAVGEITPDNQLSIVGPRAHRRAQCTNGA